MNGFDEGEALSLGHVPGGAKWEFDASVAAVFDDMLARSIPQYDVMRSLSFDLGSRFVVDGTDVVDLGASRGKAVLPFVERFGALNRFHLVETAPAMLAELHKVFDPYSAVVQVHDMDLRRDFPNVRASVILSILTLQFTPIEYRLKILRNCYLSLMPGGALIFVEKVIGGTADIDDLYVNAYYGLKGQHGYGADEIQKKRAALEGVLVPVTARMNEEFLRGAGFVEFDCFWRWANFAGWIAVRT